jgi:hypothetical protein
MVLCFRADPQTTQGEARSIAALAHRHHWNRILVVMPTTQASRARLRIVRCYSGQVLEVGVPDPGLWAWMRGIAYELGPSSRRSCSNRPAEGLAASGSAPEGSGPDEPRLMGLRFGCHENATVLRPFPRCWRCTVP